jgi:rSAM/selenodomain-associated transferase 2
LVSGKSEQNKNIFSTKRLRAFVRRRRTVNSGHDLMLLTGTALITVVIPTLNAAARLPACLNALVAAAVDGIVREVIVVDGGSTDATLEIAEGFGAKILTASEGRGGQLAAGANTALGEWLLFLHADTVLDENWSGEAVSFIDADTHEAAVFTLAFDARGLAPRAVAAGAMLRTRFFKSPYGDQGLLISKKAYEEIGGFAGMPLFEDVDIVDRLRKQFGPKAIRVLSAKAVTSPARYECDGYMRRVLKNALLVLRYRLGASPDDLARQYRR